MQVGALLPCGEVSNSSPAGSQAGTLLPSREGSSSSQAIAHLPPGEGSNSPLATAHLLPREGSNPPLATAHLHLGEGSSSSQAIAHLPSGEGSNSSQVTAHLSPGEGNSSPQAGQLSNQVRSVRQGLRHSTRPRAPQAFQENNTISQEVNLTTIPPVGSPKGLLMKNLTLSGSLIFPTNL